MKKTYNSLKIEVIQFTEDVVCASEQPTVDEQNFFDGNPENLWD